MPLGGKILLKFPPNYYSLESSPLPVGSITSNNLEKIDASQSYFSYKTNVATLSNFKGTYIMIIYIVKYLKLYMFTARIRLLLLFVH